MRITRSMTGRIWLATVILILFVLSVSGLVHAGLIKDMYVSQQKKDLEQKTSRILPLIEGDVDTKRLSEAAELLDLNVMVLSPEGTVRQCVGMGMSASPVGSALHMHQSHGLHLDLVSEDTYFYQGPHEMLGQRVLAFSRPIGDEVLVVSTALDPIEKTVGAIHNVTLYTGLGGIALTGLLALGLSVTLSRPLTEMTKVAESMSQGDFSRRVETRAAGEVGTLAATLNRLADEVQSHIAEIRRLDETRRDFVANVAHEIRTPLAIIRSYNEALQDGVPADPVERDRYLADIAAEVDRLRHLADELLDLRRLESGTAQMELEPVVIPDLLRFSVDRMGALAGKKEVELVLDQASDLPIVTGHPYRLEQVLLNLMRNALHFAPAGSKVKVAAVGEEGGVEISVTDSGPGIPIDEQALLWDRFHKGDRSRSRTEGSSGFGLGLALVKSIVTAHGGRVGVESRPGAGARFYFWLPPINKLIS